MPKMEMTVQAFLRAQTVLIVGKDEDVEDNGLADKGHRLYFHNYFNSVSLMDHLQKGKLYAYGTVNSTRQDMPKFEQDNKMKRGDCDYYISNNGLLAIKWKNKKSVRFHSNYHRPDDVTFVKRKKKGGSTENIPCPRVLKDYNKYI
ncbi:hypothetical protein ILUMI_14742 [Ignelater luminosus]|uniref:PiggyBac transposable element-derived protein domain-containing protein n=1 Tax=Ignelater luminosus TaxID=2038154 RepID=A0A8K0CUD2_IGNLU|nr:hypothetical protein ILUMI_14742 [Ignelater luminosus]